MIRWKRIVAALIGSAAGAAATGQATAQCRLDLTGMTSGTELQAAIERARSGCAGPETGPRTRGLSSVGSTRGVRPVFVTFGKVQFAFNSADLLVDAYPTLNAVAQFLATAGSYRPVLSIEGHTDASGTDQYNQDLSQRRAAAVRDFLLRQPGIDPDQVTATGYGKSRPINGTDGFDPVNRRVEFVIR
jgi:outer membrane protein OmpA-like peptidoglycan-associated protein